jgi:ADP-ribose pyrophosphatase YjhB (NUDIX family)
MPTFGVNVAVIRDGQVLLTRRNDLPVWCLPGGGLDDGETLAEAAIRDVREETGLEVKLSRLVGVYSRPYWLHGGAHVILFAAQPVGGSLLTVTNETTGAGYFGSKALPDMLHNLSLPRLRLYRLPIPHIQRNPHPPPTHQTVPLLNQPGALPRR